MTPQQRFEEKVYRTEECWEWIGGFSSRYGGFYFRGKQMLAHRVLWLLHKGEIPNGLNVLHKCDNTLCVNPDHLFLGTQADNVTDMTTKGRASFGTRERVLGSNNGYASLNEEKVVLIRQLLSQGHFHAKIAERFKVSRQTIGLISNGKTWSHV